MIYAETIANPTLSVPELPVLAEVAHRAGGRLVVDSTFATLQGQPCGLDHPPPA